MLGAMTKFAILKMLQNTQCFQGGDKEQLKYETAGPLLAKINSRGGVIMIQNNHLFSDR
jgi:hypothetical protein